MSQCLIFCRTNVDCDNLEKFFNTVDGTKKFNGKVESGKEGHPSFTLSFYLSDGLSEMMFISSVLCCCF